MLVVGRAVQGLGGGALIVALYVLIARAYSVDLRPRAFSVLSAAWIVPSLVGPFVAGWLADNVSWRAVFLLVPVFVIPPAILLFPRIKGLHGGTPHPKGGRRLIAAIVAMAGLFAVQDGVLRLNLAGVAEAVVGVAVLVFSLRFLLPQGALRMTRGLPASVMMRGFLSGAFFSAEVFIPLALVETRGVSTAQAGLALAASAVFWASGSYVQSRLPGEQDRSNAVRAGAAIITVALLTLPLAVLTTLPPGITAISWAIGAFGMGLSVPSVAVQVMRLSPEEDQGVNGAAIQVFDSVMIALTTSVLGLGLAIAVAGGGATAMTYVDLWLASAVMGLVAVALAGRMRPTRV
jgi:MFS family permease